MYMELNYVLGGLLSSIVLKDKRACVAYLGEVEKYSRGRKIEDWWTNELDDIPF